MEFLPGILAAYAILFLAATSPGPSVALLLGVGAAQGRQAALVTSAGIAAGSVLLNVLTLLGVGLLLEQAAWGFTLFRIVGAAYLAWLAYGAFKRAADPVDLKVAKVRPQRYAVQFARGFALQATNPKAIVFWIAIHAVSGVATAPWAILVAFFIGAYLISFFCHGAWAMVFSSKVFQAAYARARRGVEAALGTFLAFMAFRLATER